MKYFIILLLLIFITEWEDIIIVTDEKFPKIFFKNIFYYRNYKEWNNFNINNKVEIKIIYSLCFTLFIFV